MILNGFMFICKPCLITLRDEGNENDSLAEDGTFVLAPSKSWAEYGHIDLAQGQNVLAAGEGKILNGEVKFLDNASGHYLPNGIPAQEAAVNAFTNAGFKVPPSAYIEKIYDFSLGKWVPKQ